VIRCWMYSIGLDGVFEGHQYKEFKWLVSKMLFNVFGL
jgi:hypothetical protein